MNILRKLHPRRLSNKFHEATGEKLRPWSFVFNKILFWTILLVHFHLVANVFDNTFTIEDMAGFIADIVFLNETLLKK